MLLEADIRNVLLCSPRGPVRSTPAVPPPPAYLLPSPPPPPPRPTPSTKTPQAPVAFKRERVDPALISQIEGPTQPFSLRPTPQDSALVNEVMLHVKQHLTLMAVDVHVNTRGTFQPDPSVDAIAVRVCHPGTITQTIY